MTANRLVCIYPELVDAARSILGRDHLDQLLGEGIATDEELLAKVNLALQGQGTPLRIAKVAKITPVPERPWGVVVPQKGADDG